jgi:hypothetical protein
MSFRKVKESVTKKDIHITYEFQVGLLVYAVEFFGNREDLEVVFVIADIQGTDEELRDQLSQVRKEEVAIEDIPDIKEKILEYPDEDWAVGNPIAVFTTVMTIIEKVATKYDVKCVTFSATSEKKHRIYKRMFQSRFKGWRLKEVPGLGGHGFTFELCR